MLNAQDLFPGLSGYGNYESGKVPPKGVHCLPLDGSIRMAKSLCIPFVEIVSVEWAYGNTYLPRRVGYAIPSRYKRSLTAAIKRWQSKRVPRRPQPHPDLLLCIREASRAAHRERDAASEAYNAARHTLAGNARRRKNKWYALKDCGIIAAHKQGLVRYIGASPQGMAIYEYGEGGMSCFHSTLHPVASERTLVERHPETLYVEAKDKAKGISLARVEVTLLALSPDTTGYERTAAPRVEKPEPVCWTCGEPGHVAADCPNQDWNEVEEYGAYHQGTARTETAMADRQRCVGRLPGEAQFLGDCQMTKEERYAERKRINAESPVERLERIVNQQARVHAAMVPGKVYLTSTVAQLAGLPEGRARSALNALTHMGMIESPHACPPGVCALCDSDPRYRVHHRHWLRPA